MRSYIVSFILLILFNSSLFGQELTPVFENITDGLPSTEVHDMFQDSLGYMWFATDRGICRYDGENFIKIETGSDLKSPVVFKFFKQSETRIWIVSGHGLLYWFNPYEANIKFIAHSMNKELSSYGNYSVFSRSISRMQFDSDDIYLFSRRNIGYILLTNEKVEYFGVKNKQDGLSFNIEFKIVKNHYYTSFEKKKSGDDNYINYQKTKINLSLDKLPNQYWDFGISCFLKDNETQLIAIGDRLIYQKNGVSSEAQLPSRILSMVSIEGSYFVGTFNGIFKLNKQLEIENHFLKGEVVTKVFTNDSQMMWVATLQNGIYLSIDLRINEVLSANKRSITKILKVDSHLGLYNNVLEDVIFLNSKFKSSKVYSGVYENSFSVKSSAFDLSEFLGSKRQYTSPHTDQMKGKYLLGKYDNFDFVLADKILYRVKNQKLDVHFIFEEKQQVNFSCQIDSSNLIIGSNLGLFHFTPNTHEFTKFHPTTTDNKVFNSFCTLGDLKLFGTNKGVFCLDNEEFFLLPNSVDEAIRGFSSTEEGIVYAYSDKNVFRIYQEDENIKFEKVDFQVAKKEVRIISVEIFKNQLWIATKKGLFVTKSQPKKQSRVDPFYVFCSDSVFVGDKEISLKSDIELYSEDAFKLYFNIISYDKNIARNLEYSVDSKVWFEMNKNSLSIANLPPGEYTLKVRSIEVPEKMLFTREFKVLKHFYQKGVFLILCIIALAVVGYFILKKVIQNRERKDKEELEKLNLELKLLTSKMNPHFTFNTINSIQHSIMKSDKRSAIQYLSEFALLMRKSLDFSMAERIFLQDEKEFLELYVKMENKRFDSNFTLKFEVDSDYVMNSKKIPSMLIQPLVENVILHADYQENEEKMIYVKVKYSEAYYLIQVIDYGVGKVEKKAHLDKHKSYGLEILKSRVKMYNGKEFKDDHVNMAYTLSDEKKGTTITIKLKEWKQ